VTVSKDPTTGQYKVDASTITDVRKFGYSLFGSWVTPIPKVKMFARYDRYDNNTEDRVMTKFNEKTGVLTGGDTDEATLFIFGVDFFPSNGVHVIPNLTLKRYTQSGKGQDLTARITLFAAFNTGKIQGE